MSVRTPRRKPDFAHSHIPTSFLYAFIARANGFLHDDATPFTLPPFEDLLSSETVLQNGTIVTRYDHFDPSAENAISHRYTFSIKAILGDNMSHPTHPALLRALEAPSFPLRIEYDHLLSYYQDLEDHAILFDSDFARYFHLTL